MSNEYNWHIGFYVRSMIYSSVCHVALYYDDSIRAYQYCYKKGVSTYKFETGSIIIFKKYNSSLEIDEFYPLNEIRIDNHPSGLLLNLSKNSYGVFEGDIFYKGRKLEFERQEQVLLWMHLDQVFLSEKEKLFSNYPLSEYKLKAKYKEIEDLVKSYNVEEILDGIEVTIEEYFLTKVGGDDRYIADQITTTNYPIEKLDKFLKNHFQIGKVELAHDSGYCSAYSMKDPDITAGKLDAVALDKHKTRLISSYSPKEHCDYLLNEYLQHLGYDVSESIRFFKGAITKYRRSEYSLVWNIALGKVISAQLSAIDKTTGRGMGNISKITDKSFEMLNQRVADLHHQFDALQF